MRYMVELLEAVGTQQVGKRCACMSMSNNSPTLVYATCLRCAATHALTHALTNHRLTCKPTLVYLSSKMSFKSHPQFLWLGFPLCAFVAGHNTYIIHFLH